MTELLLTDGQLELAATGFDFGECKPEWRRGAKAQATKAVEMVFEGIEKLDFYEGQDPAVVCITRKDFDSLKAKLLDEIGGEK